MHPFFEIGSISVPSYGLCMVLGIISSCYVAYIRYKRQGGKIDPILMVGAVGIGLGLLGAKIAYYIFSYGVLRLFREVLAGDFSAFEAGGLVFYGGLIGGVAGALLAIKLNNYNINELTTAIVPSIPLGHAFGRIGCLMAGCCYGLHYEGRFAVHSVYVEPTELLFPIQAIETVLNVLVFTVLILYSKKGHDGISILLTYIILYSITRFFLEFFRGDLIRGIWCGLSTSQWISCALVASCVIVFFIKLKGKANHTLTHSEVE